MGCDAFALGNHDFDFGLGILDSFLLDMDAVPLAANLRVPPGSGEGLSRIRPYAVFERGGLKIAVVGLTTPNLPNWYPAGFLSGIEVFRSLRALEHAMPLVNAGRPDVRILLVHQGLLPGADDNANEVFAVCDAFREFDFVFGGHLHWVEPGREIASTPYAQAGSGARGFLRADLALDARGAVVRRSIRYIAVDSPEAPEDPELRAKIAPALDAAWGALREPLATATARIAPSESLGGESAMQRLLAAAFQEATGADIVLHGILSPHPFAEGPVTLSDVWKAVPFENDIYVARLSKKEILSALEAASAYAGTKRQFAAYGLTYALDPDAPVGKRISDVRLAATGERLSGLKRYRVALNSYHLASGGGRFEALARAAQAPRARLEKIGSARDLLAEYLRRHPVVSPDPVRAVTVRRGASPGK
jgi:2',3'-cyclic-nucleotide 2'-phosphodiesterase/3'-nucleotidase